jgi:hypothetical protein
MNPPPSQARIGFLLCLGLVVLGAYSAVRADDWTAAIIPEGLGALSYLETNLIEDGAFTLSDVLFRERTGTYYAGDKTPLDQTGSPETGFIRSYAWGSIKWKYALVGSRLDCEIRVQNSTRDRMNVLGINLMSVRFPARPAGFGWEQGFEIAGDNIGKPTILPADYGSGQLLLCNEIARDHVRLGFSSPLAPNVYRIRMTTELTGGDDDLAVNPKRERVFRFSLRFAPSGTATNGVAGDLIQSYAKRNKFGVKWADRRPVGAIFLASQGHRSETNPRGWFNDPGLDVVSAEGKARFNELLLAKADEQIGFLKAMNAQGMIVWDIEGEQYAHLTYVGEPRKLAELAPEMAAPADAYFAKFRQAGIATGICIRPSQIVPDWDGSGGWRHSHFGFRALRELSDKIRWASNRWGCTIFYIDSNVEYFNRRDGGLATRLLQPKTLQTLARIHRRTLILPELPEDVYWSVAAPYRELRDHAFGNFASTPADVLALYPGAFSILNPAEGPIDGRMDELVSSVRRGDVLMFRAFYNDEGWNAPIREIYRRAWGDDWLTRPILDPTKR